VARVRLMAHLEPPGGSGREQLMGTRLRPMSRREPTTSTGHLPPPDQVPKPLDAPQTATGRFARGAAAGSVVAPGGCVPWEVEGP
jgi:hypothetical protein